MTTPRVVPKDLVPMPPTFEQRLAEKIGKGLVAELGNQFEMLSEAIRDNTIETSALLTQLLEQNKSLIGTLTTTPEWAENLNMTINNLVNLVATLGGKPLLENPSSVLTQEKKVSTAGTAEQLPPVKIPYGCEVSIKAKTTNTGIIYVGKSKLDAEDTTKAYPLETGESIEYKIKDLSLLWIDASVSDEGIIWTVEEDE